MSESSGKEQWSIKAAQIIEQSRSTATDDEELSPLERELQKLYLDALEANASPFVLSGLLSLSLTEDPPRAYHEVMRIAVALVAMGKLAHQRTTAARAGLLSAILLHSNNAYIRSHAVLGLSYLNERESIDPMQRALEQETDRKVKRQIEVVLSQVLGHHPDYDTDRTP